MSWFGLLLVEWQSRARGYRVDIINLGIGHLFSFAALFKLSVKLQPH